MLPLGHMGIGILMASPLIIGLSMRWVLLGTVLPDLIDKTLYYGSELFHLNWVQGTRTLGHTGILLFLIGGVGVYRGSARWVAVSIGMVTHLILDVLGDSFELFDQAATVKAILYPLLGTGFNALKPVSVASHVALSMRTYYVWTSELLGVFLLFIYYILVVKKVRVRRKSS